MQYLLVGVGGALGAISRLVVSSWLAQRLDPGFPYGTFGVNLTGSLVLGFIMTLSIERTVLPPEVRTLVAVGFVGAYTTFSTYSYETVQLLLAGSIWRAAVNILASTAAGLVAVLAGMVLARAI